MNGIHDLVNEVFNGIASINSDIDRFTFRLSQGRNGTLKLHYNDVTVAYVSQEEFMTYITTKDGYVVSRISYDLPRILEHIVELNAVALKWEVSA
jgi:hypothetical protein